MDFNQTMLEDKGHGLYVSVGRVLGLVLLTLLFPCHWQQIRAVAYCQFTSPFPCVRCGLTWLVVSASLTRTRSCQQVCSGGFRQWSYPFPHA